MDMPTENSFTIEQYLRGKVRNISVTDDALLTILADASLKAGTITSGAEVSALSEKQVDLATAFLYVWIAGSPTTSEKVSDKDGDWSHSEGGEQMSANVLNRFLRMANDIFEKYGLDKVGSNAWGMVGYGFHNIRHYGGTRKR